MSAPAFQFYPKQWLGDDKVMLMSWAARGMHFHLMCISWQQDPPCTLPDDDEMIAAWLGHPENFEALKTQIFRAWKKEDGRWLQSGLLKEFQKQTAYRESRSKNASGPHKKHVKSTCKTHDQHKEDEVEDEDSSPAGGSGGGKKDGFDRFWSIYPRKTAKAAARRSWASRQCESMSDAIIASVVRQKGWRGWQEGYVPHPASWLNGARWEDEEPPAMVNGSGHPSGNGHAPSPGLAINSIAQADSVLKALEQEIQKFLDDGKNWNRLEAPPFKEMKPESTVELEKLRNRKKAVHAMKLGMK